MTRGVNGWRLPAAILAVAVGTACGSITLLPAAKAPAPTTPVSTPVSHPDWTRIDKTAAGFAVQVPPHWDEVSTATISGLVKNNPNLPASIATQAQAIFANNTVKLFVFDFDPEATDQQYATNFSVIRDPSALGLSLQAYVDASSAQVQHQSGFKPPLDQGNLNLPAGKAGKLHYQITAAGLTFDITQFVLVHRGAGYILTFTTLPARLDKVETWYQQVAETFTFVG